MPKLNGRPSPNIGYCAKCDKYISVKTLEKGERIHISYQIKVNCPFCAIKIKEVKPIAKPIQGRFRKQLVAKRSRVSRPA